MEQELPLAQVLKEEILVMIAHDNNKGLQSKGPMSFAHYMEQSLLHDKYG